MRSSLSLVLLSALIGPEFPISIPVQLASAEIKYFSSSIPASSKYVQFVTGFLVAPGYVDLSLVEFRTTDDGNSNFNKNTNSENAADDYTDHVTDADDEYNDKGGSGDDEDEEGGSGSDAKGSNDEDASESSDEPVAVDVVTTDPPTASPGKDTPAVSGGDEDDNHEDGDEDDNHEDGERVEDKNSEDPAEDSADVSADSGTDAQDNDADEDGKDNDIFSGNDDKSDEDAEGALDADEGGEDVDAGNETDGDGADHADKPGLDAASGDTGSDRDPAEDDYYEDDEETVDVSPGDENESASSGDENEEGGAGTKPNTQTKANTKDPSEDDYYNDDERRQLSNSEEGSVVDVLFFHEPSSCVKTKEGCDWTKLGIGAKDTLGNVHYCCSEDAIKLGFCDKSIFGQIIRDDSFEGVHRPILIPSTGNFVGTLEGGSADIDKMKTKEGTGTYTLVISNCYDYGRDIFVSGPYEWKSKGGFLPGHLFEEWHFLTFLTLFYCVFLFWYARSMSTNKNSTIGIQKWILGTIILAVVELFFRTCDYFEWNKSGFRSDNILYIWILVGVLKGSISRCLLVMVSLGWGVIRDTLGDSMRKIIMLGILYGSVAFLRDATEIWYVEEVQVLSAEQEKKMLYEIYDLFEILTFVTAIIDVTFYMWILDSLNSTMQYLENMNQSMKLKRYLRLRLILLFSILFGVMWSILALSMQHLTTQF